MKRSIFSDGLMKKACLLGALSLLSACSLVRFQPIQTISKVDHTQGYRLQAEIDRKRDDPNDDMFVVLLFSGGGTRAAALGYGVLEQLQQQKIHHQGKEMPLLEQVDLVYGVSGGSVLATYFSLYGKETIPSFERRFLKQNFQRQLAKQAFSMANLPRLTSPEFGRGDLLQEQFESSLFRKATFNDLDKHRKGPFAVISATDMAIGNRLDFTQENFDALCLNLSDMPLARAVAASSAVPLIFAPITLNNNGGHCGYTLPAPLRQSMNESEPDKLQSQTRQEVVSNKITSYEDSRSRPYIHLLDGGLTDNLGLRNLLDISEIYSANALHEQFLGGKIKKIVIINVNAQNKLASKIDESAAVPGIADVINAIVNIPIDQYSQESLRRFRAFADEWNEKMRESKSGREVGLYFVSLNLLDLPESQLRQNVLNIPTRGRLRKRKIKHAKPVAAAVAA